MTFEGTHVAGYGAKVSLDRRQARRTMLRDEILLILGRIGAPTSVGILSAMTGCPDLVVVGVLRQMRGMGWVTVSDGRWSLVPTPDDYSDYSGADDGDGLTG